MFSRKPSDYVVAQDITNHLQLLTGDVVTISEMGYTQLQCEDAFWRNVAIGGTVAALSVATCGGIGIVSGPAFSLGIASEAVALTAGVVGGTATALGQNAYDQFTVSNQTLKTVGFVGKVIEYGQKFMSKLYHTHVEFYIPNDDGGYDTKDVWVDAHHLFKLITITEDKRRTSEEQRLAKQAQDAYDAQSLEEHRASFAPENVTLMSKNSSLSHKVSRLAVSLDGTNKQLTVAQKDLRSTKNDLSTTRRQLVSTSVDLTIASTEVKELQTSLEGAKTQRNLLAALGPFALLLLLL